MVPPRKFCRNFIFDMFPEEVCRVNIVDLQDENGGPVPLSWFNKGAKAAETLSVLLVLLSLYSLEIYAGKTLPKENFLNLSSSNI